MDRSTSQFLDTARWLSAFTVVAAHVCALLLVDEVKVVQPAMGLRLFFCLKNTGHVAVVIFFVVSGFLVGGRELLRTLDGEEFDFSRYAVQRFSRIYTVLVPALIVTAILDYSGQHYFNESQLYTAGQGFGSLDYSIANRDDLATFAGNILMLQTITVEPFGGNGPLWSLANEWWYYVVFGLFLFSVSRNRTPLLRVTGLTTSLIVLSVLPSNISLWFTIWLLGVGLAVLDRFWSGAEFRHAIWLMFIGFAVSLYGMSWGPALAAGLPENVRRLTNLMVDGVAALAFAAPLLSAKNASFRIGGRMNQYLAGFSYTLYLVHFPALVFLSSFLHDVLGTGFGLPPNPASVALVVAFVAALCAYAWCFAYVTERHTPAVRNALTRILSRVANSG